MNKEDRKKLSTLLKKVDEFEYIRDDSKYALEKSINNLRDEVFHYSKPAFDTEDEADLFANNFVKDLYSIKEKVHVILSNKIAALDEEIEDFLCS